MQENISLKVGVAAIYFFRIYNLMTLSNYFYKNIADNGGCLGLFQLIGISNIISNNFIEI